MLRKWLRQKYALDLDQAVAAIRQVNSSLAMVASDRLLHKHFRSLERSLDSETVEERVVLLDGLWGTRLHIEPRAAQCISDSLRKNADSLVTLLGKLNTRVLEHNPEQVIAAAAVALPVITCAATADGAALRKNFSFAAKFFHWTCPTVFPIVDAKARSCINQLQRKAKIWRTLRVHACQDAAHLESDYRRWICFYSDVIAGLDCKDRDALKRADYDSQPMNLRVENSLLRILDKVFYRQGGGSGQSRF